MPSFQDSAVIFFLALMLFGPKKLPELARYVGKLMGEFRRASSEFRLQMEDEFRQVEQAEQQKKIAAIEAAAPVQPLLDIPEPEHPHIDPPLQAAEDVEPAPESGGTSIPEHHIDGRPGYVAAESESAPEPIAIASNGDLHMMPPATGLPIGRSKPQPAASPFDFVPQAPAPEAPHEAEAPHA